MSQQLSVSRILLRALAVSVGVVALISTSASAEENQTAATCAVWKFSGKGYGTIPVPGDQAHQAMFPWWCPPCYEWDKSGKWGALQSQWTNVDFKKFDIPVDKVQAMFEKHRIEAGVPHVKIWVKTAGKWTVPPGGRLYYTELFKNGKPSTDKINEILNKYCKKDDNLANTKPAPEPTPTPSEDPNESVASGSETEVPEATDDYMPVEEDLLTEDSAGLEASEYELDHYEY